MKLKFLFLLFINGCAAQELQIELPDKKIEVVAPGSDCSREFLKSLPVKFKGYYENDKKRAESVKNALLNSENEVVWALRGGFGTANVVEILYEDQEFIKSIKKRKSYPIVIGYSDITALHLFLSQEFGWKTIHGPVFKEIKEKQGSFKATNEILNGVKEIKFVGLEPINDLARNSEVITGKLTGGNLSIIQTSIGTSWQIDAKDKILFLEDCHEKPYQIARVLNHLKAAGILDGVKAIIIGNLCDSSNYMSDTIKDFAQTVAIPIYSLDVFGHGVYNYPMVYNGDATISSIDKVMILKNLTGE